jgi:hypothetical protein
MWESAYLVSVGLLRGEVARWLEEFISTCDAERAADLMVHLESTVAPVSGGLSDDAPAIVTTVIAGLPRMASGARVEALLLLTQILGSVEATESDVAAEVGRLLEGALPNLAALIETGSEAEIAQGIDLISMAAMQSRSAATRAVFYLSRIAETSGGLVKASAERELSEVGKALT